MTVYDASSYTGGGDMQAPAFRRRRPYAPPTVAPTASPATAPVTTGPGPQITTTMAGAGGPSGFPASSPPPSSAPSLPGTQTRGFGPGGDLRGTQIAPTPFNRPQAIGSYAQQFGSYFNYKPTQFQGVNTQVAGQTVDPNVQFNSVNTDLTPGQSIAPTESAALQRFRALQQGGAESLNSGPSRSEIAQKTLDAFDTRAQPQIRDQLRAVGQRAASLGRLGMGDTAVEALNPYTDYLKERAALSNELAASTATGEIADRRNNLDAYSGLVGQEAGLGAATRAELRGERDYSTGIQDTNIGRRIGERNTGLDVATGNVTRAMQNRDYATGLAERNVGRQANERDTALSVDQSNNMNDLNARRAALESYAGLSSQDQNAEAGYRNELRGERGYQTDAAQQATDNALRGTMAEDQLYGNDYQRALDALGMGYQGNPSGALGGAADNYSQQASQSYGGASDILAQILARRKAAQAQRGA